MDITTNITVSTGGPIDLENTVTLCSGALHPTLNPKDAQYLQNVKKYLLKLNDISLVKIFCWQKSLNIINYDLIFSFVTQ